jgi:phage-related protein
MKVFYSHNKIADFIYRLPNDSFQTFMRSLDQLIERGHELRMPHSKSMGNGLFELRVPSKPPIRAVFGFREDKVLIVHIFFKKTIRIPRSDMDYAVHLWKSTVA